MKCWRYGKYGGVFVLSLLGWLGVGLVCAQAEVPTSRFIGSKKTQTSSRQRVSLSPAWRLVARDALRLRWQSPTACVFVDAASGDIFCLPPPQGIPRPRWHTFMSWAMEQEPAVLPIPPIDPEPYSEPFYKPIDGEEWVPRPGNPLRATFEILVAVSFATVLYVFTSDGSDADYPTRLDTLLQKARWQGGVRFDDNSVRYNSLPGHPLSGTFYYQFGRSNQLKPTDAIWLSMLGVLLWEVLGEIGEVNSINDWFLTGLAGAAIGETLFQTSQFFLQSRASWLNWILGFVFAPIDWVHRWADWRGPVSSAWLSPSGFSLNYDRQLNLIVGWETGWDTFYLPALARVRSEEALSHTWRNTIHLALGATLLRRVWSQEEEEPDVYSKRTGTFDIPMVRWQLSFGLNDEGLASLRWYADVMIWAWGHMSNEPHFYRERLRQGNVYLLGFLAGFDHQEYISNWKKNEIPPAQRHDFVAIVRTLGPFALGQIVWQHLYLRAVVDVTFDFAANYSNAYRRRLDVVPIEERLPALLRKEGYFFGLGGTFRASVEAAYRGIVLQYNFHYSQHYGIVGLDRRLDVIDRDIRLQASLVQHDILIEIPIYTPLVLRVQYNDWYKWDLMEELFVRQIQEAFAMIHHRRTLYVLVTGQF